ncbi:hypothetical protein Patl1_17554 [Pistacia atlantica]|uniref:Uncharacterized protein n=1 Tax=Pistacia atlantica TaxID=434234 RepID=A0ACC1C3F7_9ROSI|nr:hypothetical protein Patl1_17554 [Pistacia atlantica]
MQQTQPNVAIVPTPGMGHLIPLVELANQLALHHNFLVTFIIPTDGSPMKPQRRVLQSLPNSISTIFLPPTNFDDLPEDLLMVFGTDALEVAKEFGILSFIFFPSNALVLSFVLHLPELDKKVTCEFRDLPEPLQLPGCVPIHGRDLADSVQHKKSETYKWLLGVAKQYHHFAAGIMVNSFMDLELAVFKALMEGDRSGFRPPVYPVGPLIQNAFINEAEHEQSDCLKWLDEQPSGSVLFISFGSGGTLSQEQLNELALGLEMSGQRFLWVVRSPHERAANATYFSVQSIEDPFDFLPKGFVERTKGVGLVVSSWAPQVQILSHESTGGFLSHCGWNSILESIVHGVPLIAWPLYAEQKMNAVQLTDDLKVAMRVQVNENGLVGKEDIAKCARGLIGGEEGKLLRKNMRKHKDAAANVLSQDGSSTKSLAQPLLFCGQPRENLRVRVSRAGCTDMEKPIATLDKDTTCSSWNYCGQRLATGSVDGTLSIFDSRDPASSSFTCSSRTKVYDGGIIKVVWVPPEYGDAIACICIDGSLLLWEEVVEDAQPLQWKLYKSFKTNSAQLLDVQFGVSSTSLKMVAAYSDGHVRVYELPDPLELKNWQLQAEFQNVIESLATFARASCLSASISWNPLKGENQESSFVLGFNSNTLQLNSSKVC